MSSSYRHWPLIAIASFLVVGAAAFASDRGRDSAKPADNSLRENAMARGPVEALHVDGTLWITINQLSNSASLIDIEARTVLDEIQLGAYPQDIAAIPSPPGKAISKRFAVSCRDAGVVQLLSIAAPTKRLCIEKEIEVGFLPNAIAIGGSTANPVAYVSRMAADDVVQVDLLGGTITNDFEVGKWPTSLAIVSPIEDKSGTAPQRLAVGLSGESRIAIHDASSGGFLHDAWLSSGINIGKLTPSSTGKHVYFPWMLYRSNPITSINIQRGWVLASRIARVNVAEEEYREAMSLDVRGRAVADPWEIAFSRSEDWLACTSSGTGELLVYRADGLPLEGAGGPGDLIDAGLENAPDRFYRIDLGGRPMSVKLDATTGQFVVTNYIRDTLQVVDLESRTVAAEVSLGSGPSKTDDQQVARGRAIFFDATHSLDQWYSCHSCHQNGGTNAKAMDTLNDGSELTTKTVLPLWQVDQTGPWTWHGWQTDLRASLQNSFTSTMKGKPVSESELDDLQAFLATLGPPRNPFLNKNDSLALRGKKVFERSGCSDCHSGSNFSDGEIHEVGLESPEDAYEGFNTPSLRGVHAKPRLLHDGRSKSLRDVLTSWHLAEEIGSGTALTDQELQAIIWYLKTL